MTSHENPGPWRQKLWTFLRIANVRLRFILLMVVTGLIAARWDSIAAHWERWTRPRDAGIEQVQAQLEYYCPMHPSVVRGEPGNCPICGMPLVKRARGQKTPLPEGVLGRVQLSPYRIRLAGVATTPVDYQPVSAEIRTVGTIEVDERRVVHIASRVGGRIEKLYVDFTGQPVEKDQPLVEIYSPDLVSTQQEYLLALKTVRKLEEGGPSQSAEDARAVLESAGERLHLWGIHEEQIAELRDRGQPTVRMTTRSPIGGIVTQKNVLSGNYVMEGTELYTVADLSHVWMTAYVYEHDIEHLCEGQRVEITSAVLPGRTFQGRVAFVWPVLDRATRTLRIRVDVPNEDLVLRPGMYVNAVIEARTTPTGGKALLASGPAYACPMHSEVVSERPGTCPLCGMNLEEQTIAPADGVLAIPETAVIETGTKKVVYVEREEGTFDATLVELGTPANGYYAVLRGLSYGDRVVTQGAFLVDAEIRLNPGAAGSYFGASAGPSRDKAEQPEPHGH